MASECRASAVAESLAGQCRFTVARGEYLRQFETVFLRPIRDGYDAVPVGNGDLAAVLWQPDHLTLMLNKCDISMEASQAARLVFETPMPLAARAGRLETRLSLATATATVTYSGGELGQRRAASADGSTVPFEMEKGRVICFQACPDVVYAVTRRGTRLEDVPLVEIAPRTDGSPARLGMVWYGQREGANNHTATFPLW